MAVYEYTAKDQAGREFSGTYNDIESVDVLSEELSKTGYVLVKARRGKARRKKRSKIKSSEIVNFAFEFAGMYSAGLSILRCFETFEKQTENEALRDVIFDVRQELEAGSSLERAFAKHKKLFSEFFLGMIEAGESGGKLAIALEMSAVYLEKQADLKSKVKAAFTYPIVVGVTCVLIVGCLLVFVVPIFAKLYKQLHVELPGPTQFLVFLSYLIREGWWALIIGAVVIVVAVRWLRRNPYAKEKWDNFKLIMPIFGKLNRMVVVSNFMRTFAMLTSVGVSLVRALEVAGLVANNHKMSEVTKELQKAVESGNSVADSMKEHNIFPPMIKQMAFSGEEVGELPQMLTKGVDFLDKKIDRTITALVVKLEPALTIVMGLIVGFILMGVYLPMFDYMQHLK